MMIRHPAKKMLMPFGLWLPGSPLPAALGIGGHGMGCCCFCDPCDGAVPEGLSVVISGIVDDECSDCDAFNDTYILDREIDPFEFGTPPFRRCETQHIYTAGSPSSCSSGDFFITGIQTRQLDGSFGFIGIESSLALPSATGIFQWGKSLTDSELDCDVTDLVLPLISGAADECDISSSIATVTSLYV